jgi:CoA:oxalate CoA-transferase
VKALDDLRVLDLSHYVAGPHAATILADFGADVIQIEPLKGSAGRRLISSRPAEVARLHMWNRWRNRRNMALDLQTEKGRTIFLEMVKTADIVIQNFGSTVMDRLGLGYDILRETNPRIIYCAISGYGQEGENKDRPAFDPIIQAESGVMSATGFPENPPVKVGINIADYAGGVYAVVGILIALHFREKTGEGQMVDAALFDAMLHWTVGEIGAIAATGQERMGNRHPWASPSNVYQTKDDKSILIIVQTDEQWERFLKFIGREELISEKWSFDTRLRRTDEIDSWASKWVREKAFEEIHMLLNEARIVNSGVAKLKDLEDSISVIEREMCNIVDDPVAGRLSGVIGVVPKLSKTPGSIGIERGLPTLGQHTEEILVPLGHSAEEIAKLRKERVIL